MKAEINSNLLKDSNRLYKVFTTEDANVYSYALEDIFKSDAELTYSLQEHLDDILDLKINEFIDAFLRDYKNKFIICRIK